MFPVDAALRSALVFAVRAAHGRNGFPSRVDYLRRYLRANSYKYSRKQVEKALRALVKEGELTREVETTTQAHCSFQLKRAYFRLPHPNPNL